MLMPFEKLNKADDFIQIPNKASPINGNQFMNLRLHLQSENFRISPLKSLRIVEYLEWTLFFCGAGADLMRKAVEQMFPKKKKKVRMDESRRIMLETVKRSGIF